MYKIGDFSQLGQVTVRTLRHYDRLGLLAPGHVDQFTNYRYYTADQLPTLNRILALRDLGFSLEDIGQMLESDITVEEMQSMLAQKQRDIEEQLREESARLRRVSARLRQIKQDGEPFPYDVVVKSVPEISLLSTRATVPNVPAMGQFRHRLLSQLYGWLETTKIEFGQEIVAYHNRSYSMENIEMSMGVEVKGEVVVPDDAPVEIRKLVLPDAPEAASIVYNGPIYNVPEVVSALYGWMGTHGYTSAGSYREIHLFGCELELASNLAYEELMQTNFVYEVLVPIEHF